jgi:hypothetical protein
MPIELTEKIGDQLANRPHLDLELVQPEVRGRGKSFVTVGDDETPAEAKDRNRGECTAFEHGRSVGRDLMPGVGYMEQVHDLLGANEPCRSRAS